MSTLSFDPWRHAKRVLCVRLDSLGDVLMTTPAIRAVKESLLESHITLLTSPAGGEVANLIPEVDDVLIYDAPWMKSSVFRENSLGDLEVIRRLKEGQFDAAVIFTVYSQNPLPTALVCFLADIPLRVAHCRENPYQLLTHWVPEKEPHSIVRHEVRRQLDLVASVGWSSRNEKLSLNRWKEIEHQIVDRLKSEGIHLRDRWIVLHPGATAPSRRYPVEQFATTARILNQEKGYQVIVTGSESEKWIAEDLVKIAQVPIISWVGSLQLREFVSLISLAPIVLSNNTSTVHIAAACGTPVVDLYALTNPQHTPWQVPHRVLYRDVPCRYCYKSICPEGHNNCIRLLPPEQVVEAVHELYEESRHRNNDKWDPQISELPPLTQGGMPCTY